MRNLRDEDPAMSLFDTIVEDDEDVEGCEDDDFEYVPDDEDVEEPIIDDMADDEA